MNTRTRTFLLAIGLGMLTLLAGGFASQARAAAPRGNDPGDGAPFLVFLPHVAAPCRGGLCGRVTLDGAPASGVGLDVRFFDGSGWSTLASTTTGANGDYTFGGLPGLQPGQQYYVRYNNPAGTPGRLWLWGTRSLTAYAAGSSVDMGSFDIADVALTDPADGATVALPYTFHWTPRPATPGDNYEFDLFEPDTGDPFAYTDPPLGYVGSFTLYSLPEGFAPGVPYAWQVAVHSTDGGFGISYGTRVVTFANAGAAPASAAAPEASQPGTLTLRDLDLRSDEALTRP